MITKCDYCGSTIEYDRDDYGVVVDSIDGIYIICPVCGKAIFLAVADIF